MLIKRPGDIAPSEITPRTLFDQRRDFLRQSGAGLIAGAALWAGLPSGARAASLGALSKSAFSTMEEMTPRKDVTSYNNFYEFGTDKADPAERAGVMKTRPWTVRIEGLVNKPRTFDIDEILRMAPLEERIYRLRCVEAWSMVIPWVGFPLSALLKQVDPQGSAKYVQFISHYDPKIMSRLPVLDWPYREGLRLDEAMHPLTLLTVGLYGETLPNQNGAPVRIVVPCPHRSGWPPMPAPSPSSRSASHAWPGATCTSSVAATCASSPTVLSEARRRKCWPRTARWSSTCTPARWTPTTRGCP